MGDTKDRSSVQMEQRWGKKDPWRWSAEEDDDGEEQLASSTGIERGENRGKVKRQCGGLLIYGRQASRINLPQVPSATPPGSSTHGASAIDSLNNLRIIIILIMILFHGQQRSDGNKMQMTDGAVILTVLLWQASIKGIMHRGGGAQWT